MHSASLSLQTPTGFAYQCPDFEEETEEDELPDDDGRFDAYA